MIFTDILELGKVIPPEEKTFLDIEKFVCTLYAKAGHNVNTIRYNIFSKSSNPQSHYLPPTQDALKKHIMRANYQTAIWRNAFSHDPLSVSPEGKGWKFQDGEVKIDWMSQQPAPTAILKLVACNCTTGCQIQRCSCHKNGLPCTDVCGCEDNCENTVQIEDNSHSNVSHDD